MTDKQYYAVVDLSNHFAKVNRKCLRTGEVGTCLPVSEDKEWLDSLVKNGQEIGPRAIYSLPEGEFKVVKHSEASFTKEYFSD